MYLFLRLVACLLGVRVIRTPLKRQAKFFRHIDVADMVRMISPDSCEISVRALEIGTNKVQLQVTGPLPVAPALSRGQRRLAWVARRFGYRVVTKVDPAVTHRIVQDLDIFGILSYVSLGREFAFSVNKIRNGKCQLRIDYPSDVQVSAT
jgi:hypothetical protein